jgi:hypothetical protein
MKLSINNSKSGISLILESYLHFKFSALKMEAVCFFRTLYLPANLHGVMTQNNIVNCIAVRFSDVRSFIFILSNVEILRLKLAPSGSQKKRGLVAIKYRRIHTQTFAYCSLWNENWHGDWSKHVSIFAFRFYNHNCSAVHSEGKEVVNPCTR